MGNKEALQAITDAVNAAVVALDDLAAKLAGGADISADLTNLATSLKAAVAKDDPPPPVPA